MTSSAVLNRDILNQHVIDPEICIRCNTCEATCPVGAVTHDSNNYVVDASKCNFCMACVPPCPTGSIDNWRSVPLLRVYTLEEQLGWEELPAALSADELEAAQVDSASDAASLVTEAVTPTALQNPAPIVVAPSYGSIIAPFSAAAPKVNLFGPAASEKFATATVTGNVRVTQAGKQYDTHHIVLDFGTTQFPVLEGQSIGVIAPGLDSKGKPHHARQYSLANARNGERPGYNNVSLTIKRVLEDHQGKPVHGVASNFMCDLNIGDQVQVIGPFGSSFLMPNHPRSNIVMICTGTGSAPMRAMTEWRRRERKANQFDGGKLLLFFGARTQEELPYFGPLQSLPKDFIDIELAFSRTAGKAKRYVQDAMRDRSADLAKLLADTDTYIYVCGLKAMEEGVVLTLRSIAEQAGMDWSSLSAALKNEGRLHLETY